jgi:hypothetical protein
MNKFFRNLVLGAWVTSLGGCATLFGNDNDQVKFDSEPEGATVELNGAKIGVTPVTTSLSRKMDTATAVFRKEGYSTQTVNLPKTLAPAAWFNIGFTTTTFGATSWGIDAASGHLLQYSPKSYVIQLEPTGAPKPRTQISPLDYTLANYEALRKETASGSGEAFAGLCATYEMTQTRCQAYYEKLTRPPTRLLDQPNSLAWYRAVDHVALSE